jgi:hypothetical protein
MILIYSIFLEGYYLSVFNWELKIFTAYIIINNMINLLVYFKRKFFLKCIFYK